MQRFSYLRHPRRLWLIVAALLANAAVCADEPWNEKPPTDWDRSDVHRILYDSPWVKHFTHSKRALEFDAPDQGPSGMELRGYHAKESKEDGSEMTEFYIRWVSSRTLREASTRRETLLKSIPPSASEAVVPQWLDEFEVSIAGPDMSGFDGLKESSLRSKCYLWISAKRKIKPSHVEFARSGNGKIRGVLFRFPRETADGEPRISNHDAKVWFIEYGGKVEIRVRFNLTMMVDSQGLDL